MELLKEPCMVKIRFLSLSNALFLQGLLKHKRIFLLCPGRYLLTMMDAQHSTLAVEQFWSTNHWPTKARQRSINSLHCDKIISLSSMCTTQDLWFRATHFMCKVASWLWYLWVEQVLPVRKHYTSQHPFLILTMLLSTSTSHCSSVLVANKLPIKATYITMAGIIQRPSLQYYTKHYHTQRFIIHIVYLGSIRLH